MTYAEMTQLYLQSPEFAKLEGNSKDQYQLYMGRLVTIGGKLPVADSHMPIAIARSRSPLNASGGNLSATWFKLINTYKNNGTPVSNSVKLMMRTCIKIVYSWGVANGHLKPNENPAPYIPMFKHEPASKNPFKLDEISAIEVAIKDGKLTPYLIAYAMFGLFAFRSGCRPDEMFNHEKVWFSRLDGKQYYEVHDAKGKAQGEIARHVLMLEHEKAILEYFAAQPKAMGHERYTFRTSNGRKFIQSSVAENFKTVCQLAGVETRRFYYLRHGLANAMEDAGYPINQIANRLGNTEKVVRSNYLSRGGYQKADTFKGV